jgi:hypothetical protein
MKVEDINAKMLIKIREQSVFDSSHYPNSDDQRDTVIRIAAKELFELLDSEERKNYGQFPKYDTFTKCVDKVVEITDKILVDSLSIFIPSSELQGRILQQLIKCLKIKSK